MSDLPNDTRGRVGPPNGKTAKVKALKAMTPEQRKAHRKMWRAKEKKKK